MCIIILTGDNGLGVESAERTESANALAARSYWVNAEAFPGMRNLGEEAGQGSSGVRLKLKNPVLNMLIQDVCETSQFEISTR